MRKTLIAAAMACACGSAHAQITDDFNRPNAPNLGPNYTVANGGLSISNNSAVGSFASLSTYNGSSATSASIDVALRGADSGSYVALALGYLSGSSYFVKVQDNDGDGWFDSYGFYTGNNNSVTALQSLNGFQSANVSVSYVGTIATLLIDAGAGTQSYAHDYGFAPGSLDIGLGINRKGVADNLKFDGAPMPGGVPEPAGWAMMILGFGVAGAGMRGRRARVAMA